MRTVRFVLLGGLLLLLAGCGPKTKDLLVGKWQAQDQQNKHTLEFTREGGFLLAKGNYAAKGKYQLVNDKEMEVEYELPDELYQQEKKNYEDRKRLAQTSGDMGLKLPFNQPEPAKQIKAKAQVAVTKEELTLRWPQGEMTYRRVK